MRNTGVFLIAVLGVAAQAPPRSSLGESTARGITLATPSLGYFAGAAGRDVRPVHGLQEFAGLGAPLQLAGEIRRLILSPDQRFALSQRNDGRWSVLMNVGDAIGAPVDTAEGAEQVAISPTGNSAAFYRADTGRIEVVAGLPDAPAAAFAATVPGNVAVVSLAVNDRADLILLGVRAGDISSVLALRRDAAAASLLQVGDPSAIVFRRNSSEAFVADRKHDQIVALKVHGEAQELQTIAGAESGIARPEALAVDEESGTVLVVNSGTRSIVAVPASGGKSTVIGCPFAVSRIAPLREKQAYAVGAADGSAAALIRVGAEGPRLSFLPAVD